jgi:hypothetical protein
MASNLFTKTYRAVGAIPAYTIVKFDAAADYDVSAAAAAGNELVGVTTEVAAVDGEPVDVIHSGTAFVILGVGGCARGQNLTSDAAGAAVVAVAGNRSIGKAVQTGLVGEVIEVLLAPGTA